MIPQVEMACSPSEQGHCLVEEVHMRTLWGVVLGVVALTGCSGLPAPSEVQYQQYQRDVQAIRAWIRGPLMDSCRSLPGPESRAGCVALHDRQLASLRQETPTHEEEYRTELVKAKGTDELRRLWGPSERETWLRGPRTEACKKGPSVRDVRNCLEGIEKDLDKLSRPDDIAFDPPEVRAERAVTRTAVQKQERALERQREHELELARQQAAGQALLGLGMGGGLFPRPPGFSVPTYQPYQFQSAPLPLTRPQPSVSCTTRMVGDIGYTDCN